jgi:hypothetical protein
MSGERFRLHEIKRFYGLDLKTNPIDVADGRSLDCQNVRHNKNGTVSKRSGNEIMFDFDEASSIEVDEVGSCKLSGTKYWFRFADGKFRYATSRTGALTTIAPSPAISTTGQIWCAVLDDKLFFVDGTNALRYFDGTSINTSSIYARPTVAATSASGAGAFTYIYTVDNGLGESPAVGTLLSSIISAATIRIQGNTGPQTLVAGDVVRIYSRADTIAAASKLVATHTWSAGDVAAGHADIVTVAISDSQTQLYSELGVALNKTAPTGLIGIEVHYGRLVGWKDDSVYNSKVSNPHSWPDDSAQREAFVYGFGLGDGEGVQVCKSFRESLFVLKKTKIAVFGGIGPDDTGNNAYSFRRLETNGHGCSAPKSAVVVGEEKRLFLVYRALSGFYATNGLDPVRIGEDIEPALSAVTEATQALGVAFHHRRDGTYIYFEGGSSSKTGWFLDVREDKAQMIGWFKWNGINPKCVAWDDDRYLFGTAQGFAACERASGTSSDFSDVEIQRVTDANVDTAADTIAVTSCPVTGTPVLVRTTGTLPTGLVAGTTYYAIKISAVSMKLASSRANALSGTAINITAAGSGTFSIVNTKAIDGYYTTNWIKFGTASRVKKLQKLWLAFSAVAENVAIIVSSAYDWSGTFQDPQSLTTGASQQWGTGSWGSFVWGDGFVASAKNIAIARRKARAIRYKVANSTIDQDFAIQGLEQGYEILRNRGGFA